MYPSPQYRTLLRCLTPLTTHLTPLTTYHTLLTTPVPDTTHYYLTPLTTYRILLTTRRILLTAFARRLIARVDAGDASEIDDTLYEMRSLMCCAQVAVWGRN